jgi:hypothetical protein
MNGILGSTAFRIEGGSRQNAWPGTVTAHRGPWRSLLPFGGHSENAGLEIAVIPLFNIQEFADPMVSLQATSQKNIGL